MKITIKGNPEEIAALVTAIQERQEIRLDSHVELDGEQFCEAAVKCYERQRDESGQIIREQTSWKFTEVPTAALVEELRKHEGVETHIAKPYADLEVKVNGPATVLVITD